MKIKTNKLTARGLDWAVAKCEGVETIYYGDSLWYVDSINGRNYEWNPSESWLLGGPIVEREGICLCPRWDSEAPFWVAKYGRQEQFGDTFLIAAMRCYVADKLGDEIDVPEKLL